MRAIVITAPGGGDNLNVTEAPAPTPGHGEVLIDVAYCGCNFADTMIAKGTYPHPKGYPLIGGLEVSGKIAKVGPDVHGFAVGDAVASFLEEARGFADQCVAAAERLVAIPDGMGLNVAASFPLQALTDWHLLHNVSVTKPGDVILLHAIGGGVGLLATQLAVQAGATVIGTVGTRGKEKRALEFGAAKVVNREEEDFVAAAMAFTGGKGVDKIVDSTGASILDRSFATIRKLGHVVSFRRSRGPAISQSVGEAGVEIADLHPLSSRPCRFCFRRVAQECRRSRRRGHGRRVEGSN